jgi:cell division protein FtsB
MKIVLAANIILVGLVAWGFLGEYQRSRALQQEIAALDARATELRQENLELTDLREKLAGSNAMEREARLKLNLQKPGEEVVVIRGEPAVATRSVVASPDGTDAASAEEAPTSLGNARRWWDFFFNNER